MSFFDCMVDALKKGRVTEKMYRGMEDYLKQHGIDFQKSDFTSPEERKILEDAIKNVDAATAQKKKELVLGVQAKERNEAMISKGGKRPVMPLIDSLQSVENRASVIKQQWGSMMDKFFQRYAKGNFLGNFLRHEADRDKFGEEMMNAGSSGSKEHAALAKEVQGVMRESVQRRNAAGENIFERKNYGLPTAHDGVGMYKVKFDQWYKDAVQNISTIDRKPLGMVEDLRSVMRDVYDAVVAGHAGNGSGDPINSRRVFDFADYKGWKAYNEKYGMSGGDPVNAIEKHISGAAQDAAMLEQFGPRPNAMVEHLKKFSFNKAAELNKTERNSVKKVLYTNQAKRDLAQFNGMWRAMTESDSPLSTLGAFYTGARSIVYMKIAEVAYLSQLPIDLFSRIPTLKMINNLPASSMVNAVTGYAKNLGSDERRQLAVKMGVGGDHLLNELHKGNDSVIREHPIMGRVMSVNEPVARAFFVHGHMESLPRMMALDFLTNFAKWKDMKFDALPIKAALDRAGLTKEDWDAFRKTPVSEQVGMKMLSPTDVMKRTDMTREAARDLATKWGMFVNGEARETVPAPNLKNRYALAGNFDHNSPAGMIVKDMTVAVQFTLSTMSMLLRGFMLRQGVASKAGYAAAVGTALLGANALRMQAKAITAGRDPYDMNPANPKGRDFWVNNLMTSGFAGPFIDLLNPGRSGSVSKIIGDTATTLYHGGKYLTGGTDVNPHTAGKLFDIYRHFLPGADGWYTQLVGSNWMLDNIAREVDPDAYNRQMRTQQYYQNHWGQGSWWQRGESGPSRAPDLEKAFR